MLKYQDRWLLLVTDQEGRHYRECAGEEDCYRAIEEALPAITGMGRRSDGVIEIQAVMEAAI